MPELIPANLDPDAGPNGERIWYGTANDVHVHYETTDDAGGGDIELYVEGVINGRMRTTRLVDAEGRVYAEEVVDYGDAP